MLAFIITFYPLLLVLESFLFFQVPLLVSYLLLEQLTEFNNMQITP